MTKKQARLRKIFKATVQQSVSELLYYGRKEDEELSPQDVEMLFCDNAVAIEEVVEWFNDALRPVAKQMGGF